MSDDDKPPKSLTPLFERMWKSFDEYKVKKLLASWFMVEREERRHRLRTITALIIELERIKAVDRFATMHGEVIIEAVIEGDWKYAEKYTDDLFEGESDDLRARYVPLWEGFTLAAKTACAEAKRIVPGVRVKGN